MAFIDLVRVRYTIRLIKLTNDGGTPTTENTPRLEAAIDDMMGDFSRITGVSFDENNKAHVSLGIEGVLYKLEYYKDRNSVNAQAHRRTFYAGTGDMRNTRVILPDSSSTLEVSKELADTPDMDRGKSPFRNTRGVQRFSEYSGE